jgi:hypothetical protein
LDAPSLWKQALQRAATSSGNVVPGAVALAASAALWNPLPLILWGVGSAAWVLFASTSPAYTRRILLEQRQAQALKDEADRKTTRLRLDAILHQPPFLGWVRSGQLPDYLQIYDRLGEIRDRATKLLADQGDIDAASRAGIGGQLAYMLSAYLQFVRARITYLQILADLRSLDNETAPPASPAAAPLSPLSPAMRPIQARPPAQAPIQHRSMPNPPLSHSPSPAGHAGPMAAPAPFVRAEAPTTLPRVEKRLGEIDSRIAELKALAEQEPATARTREWHIGILEKRRELLLEGQKRDQQVVAQLTAFPDVFEVILGRVSASQFSASEVATYMGNVVQEIEETEKFVEALRPAMDELLVERSSALAR